MNSPGAPPPSATELIREAEALERARRFGAAAKCCRTVLSEDDRNIDAWLLLSRIEQQRQRPEAALEAIDRVVALEPENAPALCRRGSLLRVLTRLEEAAESQRRAIAADPNYAEAHNNLGNCLRDLNRLDEAVRHYEQAVTLRPDYAQAHSNLGIVLRALDRNAEAMKSLYRALVLQPDYVNAQVNLGAVMLREGKHAEAAALLTRAAAKLPNDGTVHLHLASALLQLGRGQEAEPILQRAVKLVPDQSEAEFDLALLLLEQGRFREGWKHYEARWQLRDNLNNTAAKQKRRSVPLWEGEPLDGKAMLVQAEQGLGDTIQFCRYVPMLAARGAEVTFLVTRNLTRLLAPLAASADVTARIALERRFDYRAMVMGLPRIFGTELETIPRPDGAYLFAEPDRVAAWKARIGTEGFKIAICWQGNPKTRVDKGRSIPVSAFAPLARLPGIRLISLQMRHGLDQLERLPEGMRVETLGPDFDAGRDAFLDTAAVMANCDLVVTSDTSVAHLAGALDRPIWVALSTTADWRWLRERSDSPWYRSMTLFRQPRAGDWFTVFLEMAERLGGMLGSKA